MAAEAEGSLVPVPTPSPALGYGEDPTTRGGTVIPCLYS